MQIHELCTSLEAWHKMVNKPSIIPKCTGYESKVLSFKNIPTLINFVHSRALVAGNICIQFSQFSETTASCCKNISIMPALCLNAPDITLCTKLCRHNPTNPRITCASNCWPTFCDHLHIPEYVEETWLKVVLCSVPENKLKWNEIFLKESDFNVSLAFSKLNLFFSERSGFGAKNNLEGKRKRKQTSKQRSRARNQRR